MKVIREVKELKDFLSDKRYSNNSIGFIPTMGALHNGHLSLVKASKSKNLFSVVSIFVNPTQFNTSEDLVNYPRSEEKDLELLKEVGTDLVFIPTEDQLLLKFDFGKIEKQLEGAFRPGHFNGVGIVVSKLFHLVNPDFAFFGQKDLQQYLIIRKLVEDLSFDVEVICCPIEREENGLAMSSRNERLTLDQRSNASCIFKSISLVSELLRKGESIAEAKKGGIGLINETKECQLEYLEIVNRNTLGIVEPEEIYNSTELAVCIAAYFGDVRLIDNVFVSNQK